MAQHFSIHHIRFSVRHAIRRMAIAIAAGISLTLLAAAPQAQTIVDDWGKVQMPAAPTLKPVKIDPRTTALLSLDLVKATCNAERRPRCLETLPKVAKLMADARAHNVAVIHSFTGATKVEDIISDVAPKAGEPAVQSSVDKFFNTDLDKILKDKGIQTVIVVGTTAEGAVLYTASVAAIRGYNVIVPVEGSTAGSLFGEAATAWMLANAPGVSAKTTLTKMDMITY